jgi:hypothetical protein
MPLSLFWIELVTPVSPSVEVLGIPVVPVADCSPPLMIRGWPSVAAADGRVSTDTTPTTSNHGSLRRIAGMEGSWTLVSLLLEGWERLVGAQGDGYGQFDTGCRRLIG